MKTPQWLIDPLTTPEAYDQAVEAVKDSRIPELTELYGMALLLAAAVDDGALLLELEAVWSKPMAKKIVTEIRDCIGFGITALIGEVAVRTTRKQRASCRKA